MKRLRTLVASAVGNTMGRKRTRAVMALLTALVVPVAVFAAAPPASANGNHLCETSGNYCVGAPTLALYAPVVETVSGRDLGTIPLGNNQFELVFLANTTFCVAAANNGIDVVVKHCQGDFGVVWIREFNPNGHLQFHNREFSNKFLAGHNDGTQFHAKDAGRPGWFYNFDVR